jgi:hypothetical protein
MNVVAGRALQSPDLKVAIQYGEKPFNIKAYGY